MDGPILLTGGTGFVGIEVLRRLVAQNHTIHAIVNRHPLAIDDPHIRPFPGGLFDDAALYGAAKGCAAAIHIVGIIREKRSSGITFHRLHVEATERVIRACQRQGVRRLIHMSALGARPDAASQYHQTKYEAEEAVRASGLDWTIFRPSLILGPDGEFMRMLEQWALCGPLPLADAPVIGHVVPKFMPWFSGGLLGRRGAGRVQPIQVSDVARAFIESLANEKSIGKTYPLGGADRLTWPELYRLVSSRLIGRPRATLAVPAWYGKLLTRIVPTPLLPFNRDQVIMSQEESTCDLDALVADFGFEPGGVRNTELSALRSKL